MSQAEGPLSEQQARHWRAILGVESWMRSLVSKRREIPLELVRTWLQSKYGLRRP